MKNLVELLALASLLFVFVCSLVFPGSPFMWLATISSSFTLLRIVLITLIATLLITSSFFDHHMNGILGAFAFVLTMWAMIATYNNHLQILDSLSFMGAGIALGIEALEPGIDSVARESLTAAQWRAEVKHQFVIYTLAAYAITRLVALTHPFHRATHHGHRPHAI